MSEREEWSEWFEHDGKGFPEQLLGKRLLVEAEDHFGNVYVECGVYTRLGIVHLQAWDWQHFRQRIGDIWVCPRVLRYRIRHLRGIEILQDLIADLPAPVEGVPA